MPRGRVWDRGVGAGGLEATDGPRRVPAVGGGMHHHACALWGWASGGGEVLGVRLLPACACFRSYLRPPHSLVA